MRVALVATVVIAIASVAAPLCAQVLEPPARVGGARGEGDTRTRQEVTARANLLGGFDDNLAPGDSGGLRFDDRGSGYVGFGDASLRYLVARGSQSLNVNARGFAQAYDSLGLSPSYGGDADVSGRMTLGRQNTLTFTQGVRYDPYFTLGAFNALSGELGAASPDVSVTNAVTQDRSWNITSNAQLSRDWTRRLSSGVGYTYARTTFVEGPAFDTRSKSATAWIAPAISRRGRIRSSYTYADNDFLVADGSTLPLTNQQVDLGYEHSRDLSRTRSVSFGVGAGAYHVDTVDTETRLPIKYWSPSGYGSLRYDFGRSWNASADYRRTVSVLQGLTPVFYNSDAATFRTGGALTNRLETVFVAGYVNGQAGEGAQGRYDGYTGSAQLRATLTRYWSCSVVYNHYQYRLNTAASLALNIAADMHRNTIMVGFNWNLPLVAPRGAAATN